MIVPTSPMPAPSSAEALEAEPKHTKLGDEFRTALRFNAASAAARVGCLTDQEKSPPDHARKAELRRQTLDRLKLDRELRSRQLATGAAEARQEVARAMASWMMDSDLPGTRNPDALAKLPESEREPWRALRADVEALGKRAECRTP